MVEWFRASNFYGILQNATVYKLGDRQQCAGKYPKGVVGHGELGGNTFKVVPKVVGGYGKHRVLFV
jgi:hypothetical protein